MSNYIEWEELQNDKNSPSYLLLCTVGSEYYDAFWIAY